MDSLGSAIDKLITVDMKMWNNQELLYKIRRMTFLEYKEEFFSEEGAVKLWEMLKKACDLNVQRSQLVNEIDEKMIGLITSALEGKELDNGRDIQRAHKTY